MLAIACIAVLGGGPPARGDAPGPDPFTGRGTPNGKDCHRNAATGALDWKATTGRGVWSPPSVANGVVYVGSGDGNLYAFDAATGVTLWKAYLGGTVFDSPAVADGAVYADSYAGSIYAFRLPG